MYATSCAAKRINKARGLSGFTLLEVGIASVLVAMLGSAVLLFIADQLRLSEAQSEGTALATLNTAVGAYEAKYATNLANHTAIPITGYGNVANPYAPTTTELTELGFLKNNVPTGIYGISISTTVTNGTPSGLTWIIKPFTDNLGQASQELAGAAMLSAGGDAAFSTVVNPSVVEGADGWTATNPQGSTAAIVAMRNGAGSAAYVRLDGSTPMQGSLSFNGYSLTNANSVSAATLTASGSVTGSTLTASGSVTGSTLTASAEGNDVFFGSSALYSDGSNTVIRNAGGALYVQDFSGNLKPTVSSQLITPGGNGVQVGSSYYYGDGTNSAIRQSGTLYVQNQAGSAATNVNANDYYIASIGKWASQLSGTTNNYVSVNIGNGGVYYLPSGTNRVDGYVQVTWTGSNAGVAEFIVRDTAGNIQNYFYAGDYGWNDGGSGSQWWFPVSIPVLSNSGSIQVVQIDGSNSLTWHIGSYTN